jgi:hypothetical protein
MIVLNLRQYNFSIVSSQAVAHESRGDGIGSDGVCDVEFLCANTDHMIKITLPGPFTMSRPKTSSTRTRTRRGIREVRLACD